MSTFAKCPSCNSQQATKVGFTWWGGMLGPKLLTHVKCDECGVAYNGKTGKSNTNAIAMYFLVTLALGIFLLLTIQTW